MKYRFRLFFCLIISCLVAFLPQSERSKPTEGKLKVGDIAPDFDLIVLNRDAETTEEKKIKLSDFKGKKPVFLIFGSYT